MSRILITGINGFLGSHLANFLSLQGHIIFGTTLKKKVSKNNYYCDITNSSDVNNILKMTQPEIIIHCAAKASISCEDIVEYYNVNTVGTQNIVAAGAASTSCQRFIFLSSAGIYGNQFLRTLHEDLIPMPVHHYGLSKFCAERLIANFESEFHYTIIRPFNIIGERQNKLFIVPKLVEAFKQRASSIHLGNFDVIRDYIDVFDAVRLINNVIFHTGTYGQTYNLCSGNPVSLNKLILLFEELTNHHIKINISSEFVRKNEVWKLLGSPSKLHKILGVSTPLTPLNETILRLLAVVE